MAPKSRPRMSVRADSCMKVLTNVWLNEAKDKNFVFSPLSLYVALGLLASGADGRTLEQILGFLGCKSLSRLNKVISQLVTSLYEIGRSGDGGGPKVSLVSGLWVNSDDSLKPAFKEIASSIYRAKAASVDFSTKVVISDTSYWCPIPIPGQRSDNESEQWVEKKTNGLIQDLLPPRCLDTLTKLVLANALYFKGSWQEDQFDPSETTDSKFYLLDGSSVKVPFMTYGQEYQYLKCYKGLKVLQLPYKQAATDDESRFSMYIFLPDRRNGLPDLIEKVSSDSGFLDRHLPTRKVEVGSFWIPKFKISFHLAAERVLEDLGLDLPFNEDEAELTETLMGHNQLFVSKVYHKCFVEVDEEGTEAAAATAVVEMSYSLYDDYDPPCLVSFVADHPFMFIIRGNRNGMVLFMGVVLNPLLN